MEIKVSEVLKKYDTDKVNGHHYGDAYDHVLGEFNRQEKLNILEVGTQKGGSLCAWKEYFTNATVTGVDIVDVVTDKNRNDKINYVFSDIKDYKTDETFDIIIDDGSHYSGDVVYTACTYIPKLRLNGVLIIEDVQSPEILVEFIIHLVKQLYIFFPDNKSKYDVGVMDLRHISNQYDDFLIVVKRMT